MKKKDLAIVFGITGNWAFALGNVLIGLKKHNPGLQGDIIIYYDSLSLRNRNALIKIYPVKFIRYKFPANSKQINNINIFTEVSFARYECFSLLKKYKTVAYFDVDIVMQKNIEELFDYEKNKIAIITNGTKLLKSDFCVDEIEGFNLEVLEFGSGTIILTDKITNPSEIKDWCYKKISELASKVNSPDQAILNLALQQFNLEPYKLDETYVFHPNNDGAENAKILHAYYGKKFWNGTYNAEWEENNKTWLKLGGDSYNPDWDFANRPIFIRQPYKFVKDFIKRYII